jgi:hypothetical protein
MVKTITIARSLYHLALPYELRGKIRFFAFKSLRQGGILNLLRKVGILTFNNHLQVDVSNAEQVFPNNKEDITLYKLVEENPIKSVLHFEGEKLEGMQPFVAKTETVVLDIVNGGFSLRNNHLLDKQLNLITEGGINFEKLPINLHLLRKTTHLKGTVAYLSDPDILNYYHWMCRTLPLLRIYRKFFDWQEIDFFYVGQERLSNFHKETLAKAGVKMNQVIQDACTADRIVAAINTRTIRFGDPINKEAYLFSRNLFLNNSQLKVGKKKRRIYVKRGNVNRRKVINETEIINLLENYGFESVVMDNKTVQEQAEMFNQAEAIVAIHGAALANLLFIQTGVKVIELIPYGYVNNCFYAMATYGEADYYYLQGENTNQGNIDVRYLDLYVDIHKLKNLCQRAFL